MKRSLKEKDIASAVFAEYSAEEEDKSTANSLCDCDRKNSLHFHIFNYFLISCKT